VSGSNPYAPPSARVEDVRLNTGSEDAPFFAVSTRKLVLMSICTLGFYQIYWFYKQWRCVQERNEPNIMPAMRAIFAVFFGYALFKRVRDFAHPGLKPESLAAGMLALVWLVLQLTPSLPNVPQPVNLLTFISVAGLVPVQSRINRINDQLAPDHDRNDRFSSANWVGLVLGGILFVLAVLGSMMPNE
jgi:hypothetical protein